MKVSAKKYTGSALLVTIMITSIVLIVAMSLLERIIPYSKQIRSMQDSLQAYYTAKSEVELGRLFFSQAEFRDNVDTDMHRIIGKAPVKLDLPKINTNKPGEYVIISRDTKIPLQVDLFENDEAPVGFGTSKGKPTYHYLSGFEGGLTFDLSGVNTGTSFVLSLDIDPTSTAVVQKIGVEFIYSSTTEEIPFFGTLDITTATGNLLDAKNSDGTSNLADFLSGQNCQSAHCFLKLQLKNPTQSPINVNLTSTGGEPIPDINAVLIADGLSSNGLYHARIIELLPVTQSI